MAVKLSGAFSQIIAWCLVFAVVVGFCLFAFVKSRFKSLPWIGRQADRK